MIAEPGQFLDDAKICSFTKDIGRGEVRYYHYVFATFVEDSTGIDLETTPFTHVTHDNPVHGTYCPGCNQLITIYILHKCLDSHTRLCYYCADCNLLFRTATIGTLDNFGNFTAWDEVK